MAAFVAAAGSLGRSLASGISSNSPSVDPCTHTGTRVASNLSVSSRRCKHFSSSVSISSNASRELLVSIYDLHVQRGGPRECVKVFARAGGNRPPPGARRSRPNNNRQQPQEDDGPRDGLPVNQEITATTVMLLGEDGKLVGTMSREEALFRAREMDLDLVQLDKQDPPCVKIVQYSKLKYELQKKKKEQQKKSLANRMDLKELKMRYNIDVHDYGVRVKSAQKFLRDGDKVKLIIQFKGRELEFKDLGLKLFERFEEDIGEEGIVESKLTKDARSMSMILAPNKTKISGQQGPSTDKKNAEEDSPTVAVAAAEA